jgi:hypothetical protein
MGTWHAGVLHGSGGWDKRNLGAALEVECQPEQFQ